MIRLKYTMLFILSVAVTATVSAASGRNYISIVGSSTVYPFATVVAERFGRSSGMKTPKVEATGSGGGMKLFCAGVGVEHPDITNSSRRMKASEMANSKQSPQASMSRKDIYLALAKEIPDPNGAEKLIPNPHKTWKDVHPSLPANKIEVLGPPPTSGTRDAFVELAMEGGCKQFDWIEALKKQDKKRYKSICHTIREDGAFIEAGENDNLIVQKLEANPKAFGVFGFSFLDQNADKTQGSLVDNQEPTFENIADGSYPVSRPLYFYVKKAHVGVIPGVKDFLAEFTSDKAWGDEGYLSDKGLIPMPEQERQKFNSDVRALNVLSSL